MVPYGVISDSHSHNWATFSHINKDTGLNNRLEHILDEIWRAAQTVKSEGGDTIIHCGDVFHVRGNLAPSVLNPTINLFSKITNELGLRSIILAGNHDLESNDATRIGNATVALEGAKNAGILAAQIIGASDKCVLDKIIAYKEGLKLKVEKASERVRK